MSRPKLYKDQPDAQPTDPGKGFWKIHFYGNSPKLPSVDRVEVFLSKTYGFMDLVPFLKPEFKKG